MKTVLTYGTFDLFHVGHVRLLKRLRSLGDRLIVGCSSDQFNNSKGKNSIFSYDERSEILQSCQFVDVVFPEHNWNQKADDIKLYQASIFAMGDDWAGKFDYLSDLTEVYYLPRTDGISTTDIKSVLASSQEQKLLQIKNALGTLSDLIQNYT